MEAYLLASLLVAAGLACIPASIAKNKGYSFGLWWFYGWMLFIVAIIHVSLIPDKKAQQTPINPSSNNPSNNGGSTADELKKFKELMDQGVITEEEFQEKKEELLKPTVVKKTVIADGNSNIDSLLKRAFMFLEDKEWGYADGYCEKILDINPECAEAYLGKLMVELKVPLRQELKNCSTTFDDKTNFQKAMRYANDNLKKELQGYIDFIVNRNITDAYDEAIKTMEDANSEEEYNNAAAKFQKLNDYKDSVELVKKCLEKAEKSRLTTLYDVALSTMNSARTEMQYNDAAEKFNEIISFKDADEKAKECMENSTRLAEEKKIVLAKAAKKRKKIITIAVTIVCAFVVLVILLNNVIIPNTKYNDAVALMDNKMYEEAAKSFEEISDFKDSKEKQKESLYLLALSYQDEKQYVKAIKVFDSINEYKDSATQISTCMSILAKNCISKGDTTNAIIWYDKMGDKDSANKVRYDYVLANKNSSNPVTYEYLKLLKSEGYKNSESIYNTLYKVTGKVFFNESAGDTSSSKKTIHSADSSGYNDAYCHYKVIGGVPGEEIKVRIVYETRWGMDNEPLEGYQVDTVEEFTVKPGEDNIFYDFSLASNLYYHRVTLYNEETGEKLAQATLHSLFLI